VSLRILHTRSPFWKFLGRTLVLQRFDARSLHAISRISLLSRSSLTKSRLTARLSSFRVRLDICLRMVGSPTMTGIIVSVPYVRLYGFSCVVVWGVHLYAHRTSISSSVHRPFALPRCFFSLFSMTLFATLACPLVCGCSTEVVIDLCQGRRRRTAILGK